MQTVPLGTLMNTVKISTAVLLASFSLRPSVAQDRPATERSAESYSVAVAARPSANTVAAAANSEVFQNIVIAAGKSVSINSTLDYTAANTVAVTVQCTICTTLATSLTGSGLMLQASWSVPNAGSFAVAENKSASTFPYWDAGAALFNTYGSQFRLILQNTGSGTIAIQQVTLFSHGQSAAGS
jgi:hypothetical protein